MTRDASLVWLRTGPGLHAVIETTAAAVFRWAHFRSRRSCSCCGRPDLDLSPPPTPQCCVDALAVAGGTVPVTVQGYREIASCYVDQSAP
jgi:hypothetical protein